MFILLLLFWIILNGKITVEILCIGVVICCALYAFMHKFMGYSPRKELKMISKIPAALCYVFILIIEILKANIQVIKLIYSAKLEVEPCVVRFKKSFKKDGHAAVLANCITLTPGTITADLNEDEYIVHCLDKSMAEGINTSIFVKKLDALERGL